MINLETTVSLCRHLHGTQVDKGGNPYWLHPYRVMCRLLMGWHTEHELQAALLHDVVEDTNTSLDDLALIGYDREVTDMVSLLSQRKGEETHRQYVDRILYSGNLGAMRVKLADTRDNKSPRRVAQLPEHEQGMTKRYDLVEELLCARLPVMFHQNIYAGDL